MTAEPKGDVRLRAPLLLFVFTLAVLSLQRLLAWAVLQERFAGIPTDDIAAGLALGLRYDLAVASMLVLPPLLLLSLAPDRVLGAPGFRRAVLALCAGTAALLVFGVAVDFFFFQEYNERLNGKAIDYLSYASTYALLWHDFPVALVVGGAALSYVGLRRMFAGFGFPSSAVVVPVSRSAARLALLLPLALLGVRGSVQASIDTSLAYDSDSLVLAQWTLNGPFTLREALVARCFDEEIIDPRLGPLPEDRALALAAAAVALPGDRFLGDADNPLRRISDSGRPPRDLNVVLVVLEGLSWHYVESLGGLPGLTPRLDALAGDGVLMESCFAVGTRTSRGIAGNLCGFPDLPGESVTKRVLEEPVQPDFMTLASVLQQRGHATLFVHGGDPDFDELQAFAAGHGYARTVFGDDFTSPTFRTAYGWCDEDLYAETLAELDAHEGARAAEQPFFATLLTLSFHRPYEVPAGRVPATDPGFEFAEQLDAVRYTDWALGRFLDAAAERPWFDDTLFVLVADHAGGFVEKPLSPATHRIPFVLWGRPLGDLDGTRIDTICSQTDVAPTVLSLLGGRYRHAFLGASVLDRPAGTGQALVQRTDVLSLIADDGDVLELRPGTPPRLYRWEAPDRVLPVAADADAAARCDELGARAVGLLQSAAIVYQRGSHRLQAVAAPQPSRR